MPQSLMMVNGFFISLSYFKHGKRYSRLAEAEYGPAQNGQAYRSIALAHLSYFRGTL